MKELLPELLPYREAIERSTKSALIGTIERKDTHYWSSKIGGKPYLPKGFIYPTDIEGNPMLLLAQINFSELPKLEDFPEAGIIQFYLIADDDLYGLDFSNQTKQNNFKVVFHEQVQQDNADLITDYSFLDQVDKEYFPVEGEYALSFSKQIDYLPPCDHSFADTFGIDSFEFFKQFGEKRDQIGEYFYDNFSTEDFKIGGYPFFTQHDPRSEGQYKDFDTLLLQIISKEDIMWGDVGVANFFIKKADLLRKDFSNVLYNWDCT